VAARYRRRKKSKALAHAGALGAPPACIRRSAPHNACSSLPARRASAPPIALTLGYFAGSHDAWHAGCTLRGARHLHACVFAYLSVLADILCHHRERIDGVSLSLLDGIPAHRSMGTLDVCMRVSFLRDIKRHNGRQI
jgi:hypothetical protein